MKHSPHVPAITPHKHVKCGLPTCILGLFAGLSLEGTVLIERKDANKDFYGSPVPARDILGGRVPPPEVASRLYEIIEAAEVRFAPYVVLAPATMPQLWR